MQCICNELIARLDACASLCFSADFKSLSDCNSRHDSTIPSGSRGPELARVYICIVTVGSF